MKIIFLTKSFYPNIGGVENHIYNIAKKLIRIGNYVTIICEDSFGQLPKEEIFDEIRILRINTLGYSEKNKKFIIWFWLYQNKNLFNYSDIVHIHDVFYWVLLFPGIRNKSYITFHGYEGSNPPRWQAIFQRKLSKKLCKGIINVGSFMEKWYGYHPNKTIYGAVNKSLSISKNNNSKIIYIGRLHEDTGILIYLKALKELKSLGINLELDIFGDGPLKIKAQKYINQQKLIVNLFGFKNNISNSIYNYKYCFVSRYLSILEAMVAKVPVIAVYNNQIKKDYLDCHPMRENFFVTNDPKKVAVQLIKLQKPDAETKAKIERAYQWAKKQTWEALAQEYLDLWSK